MNARKAVGDVANLARMSVIVEVSMTALGGDGVEKVGCMLAQSSASNRK